MLVMGMEGEASGLVRLVWLGMIPRPACRDLGDKFDGAFLLRGS